MIEELLFDVSEALLIPVLVLTVAALAMVIVEAGSLLVEVRRRRHRSLWGLERAVEECRGRLAAGLPAEALAALLPFA
jgi:Flp pilus assembly protein TadB